MQIKIISARISKDNRIMTPTEKQQTILDEFRDRTGEIKELRQEVSNRFGGKFVIQLMYREETQ